MLQMESEAGQILPVGQQVPTEHAEKEKSYSELQEAQSSGLPGEPELVEGGVESGQPLAGAP